VDGIELFGRILTGVLEDDLLAAGVLLVSLEDEEWGTEKERCPTGKKLGHVVSFAMDNHPA
jgi:hypothetical protein